MIIALLSAKQLEEEQLKNVISKKLYLINNVQISMDRRGNLILYSVDFPKSILSVLYILSVANCVDFFVGSEISALDAELALCVENSSIAQGIIVKADYSDITSFDRFFEKYKIGKFKKIDLNGELTHDTMQKSRDFKYVSIDKHFIVKGIGSVIIGFVLGQQIKKGERLLFLPSLKQCSIKSIQIMDIDNDAAETGSHVGLALNNASESDLSNNYAISSLDNVSEIMSVKFNPSPFYKEDVFSKQFSCSFFGEPLSIGLLKDGNAIKARFNKKIPFIKGVYLLVDASLSIGKNRVAGSIELI